MTLTAWKSRASKLAKAHAALQEPSPEAVRLALCELHALVLDAPHGVVSAYSGLPEDELTWASEAAADRLTDGDFGWILPEKSSNREWARAVGAQIRGLDHTLATTVRVDHGPVASTDDWLCDDGEAWVVPRRRARKTQRRTGQ